MNKCKKCGREFEGKFCPECGEPWRAEVERVCPHCKAVIKGKANFCSECGYSLVKQNKTFGVYLIKKCLPEVLFVLMSILAFAFLAAPVTKVSDMGLFLGAADMGSAYNVVSMEGVDGLRGCAIAFMVFAALGVVYSLYLLFVNIPDLKDGFVVKPTYTAFAFYLVYIVIGSVMIADTAALDGGMGVLSAGACPICFLVFSILFAANTVVALILRNKLGAVVKQDSVQKN